MKKQKLRKTVLIVALLLILCLGQAFAASCGDANSSGSVDIVDALLIAQYSVGLNPSNFNTSVVDVNADGVINIVDALLISQFTVGIVSELSCQTINQEPIWSAGPNTLNGSSDYIDMPDGITNNLSDFTVACWVYLYSLDNWARIFDFGGDTNVFMMLTPKSGSTGYPYFAITTSGNSGEQGINGTSALPTGSWQHIVVVKSGTTGRLFINKQEVGSNTSITLNPSDLGNTTNNFIGRSQWSQDPYLKASIDKFFVYDRALSVSEITELGNNPPPNITPTPTVIPTVSPTSTAPAISKIMPLGDSITDGTQVPGGYRIKLWSNVQNIGKSIDFVGSLSNGPTELPDKNHEGHSGWRIDQIDSNINGWMDSYKPRIVLLHIGTNDVLQNYSLSSAPSRLSGLIDKICAKLPANGKLYVAKIIPLSNSGQNANVISFNNQIPGIVQSKVSAGKPVYIVDMYSALTTADLIDGIHPTRTGYDKMADVWINAIRSDL